MGRALRGDGDRKTTGSVAAPTKSGRDRLNTNPGLATLLNLKG
jgi:hypothetical protein